MTPGATSALRQALELVRTPRGARPGHGERLPEGVLLLLKVVAGERQALDLARESTGEKDAALREAAAFYIQQVMFPTDSDCYRVLGVNADAPDDRLREHYRWLARWLHPDRNSDAWEAVYADRVNQAWQQLRTSERRLQYDQRPRPPEESSLGPAIPAFSVIRHESNLETTASGLNLRWLPTAIFVGLGLTAVVAVALLSILRWDNQGSESVPPQVALTRVEPTPVMPAPVVPATAAAPEIFEPEPAVVPAMEVFDSVAEALPSPPDEPQHSTPEAQSRLASLQPSPPTSPSPLRNSAASLAARPEGWVEASQMPSIPVELPAAVRMSSTRAAPAPPAPAAPPPAEIPGQAEELAANDVLRHFRQAYADGDLGSMRAMFTSDARSPRGDLEAILKDYGRLFKASRDRSLALQDVNWFTSGETFTIIATYQATVTAGGSGRTRHTRGDLRLDLRREDEQWRIYRLLNDERPG